MRKTVTKQNPYEGYEDLQSVLVRALDQAAIGKGRDRHAAAGEAFRDQVIFDGAKRFGPSSLLFQAFKKIEESQRLEGTRKIDEMLGAIVYISAAIIYEEEQL